MGGLVEMCLVAIFALGWLVLEWQGRRLDRKRAERRAAEERNVDSCCYQRGIRNGNIACTIGMRKRSRDRLSCMTSVVSPNNLADSCERA
jgi:hypothetical protein